MGVIKEDIFYPSADGKNTVHAVVWSPDSPKATVQIVHGIAEYVDRYDEYARFLCENGYAVVGEDHLGHGDTAKNDEDHCFFAEKNGWDTVIADILTLSRTAKQRFEGKPLFLLGHSMGSFLVRDIVLCHSNEFDGLILSGTGHQNGVTVSAGKLVTGILKLFIGYRGKSKLIESLAFGAYNGKFKPNRTEFDWISSDESAVDRYVADDRCGEKTTAGIFGDMLYGLGRIKDKKKIANIRKDLPIYIYSGANDPVGNMSAGVKTIYNMYKAADIADVTLRLYENGRHEMHNEKNKAEVMRDTVAWLEERYEKISR